MQGRWPQVAVPVSVDVVRTSGVPDRATGPIAQAAAQKPAAGAATAVAHFVARPHAVRTAKVRVLAPDDNGPEQSGRPARRGRPEQARGTVRRVPAQRPDRPETEHRTPTLAAVRRRRGRAR